MSNFSNWTPVTYSNNDAPHITPVTLNKNETALTKVMGELNSYGAGNLKDFIDYAMNNSVKEIHNFENTSDFSTTGSMQLGQALYSSVTFGCGGCTIQSNSAASASIGIYDSFSSIDLTTFPSGASSSTSDYIFFCFFVSDRTKIRNILIRLGDDDSNCYYKYISSWHNIWNFARMKKSSFGTDGSPSGWDDITFLRIYVETQTNSQSDYIICNKLWLGRKDPNSEIVSSLLVTDGSGTYDSTMYLQSLENIIAYHDKWIGKKGFHNAFYGTSSDMLQIMTGVNSFSFKCEMYSRDDEFTGNLRWYIDSHNYIDVEVTLNKLRILQCNNGTDSYIATGTLTDFISNGDRIELWVEKTPDNIIRARVEVDGMKPVYAESTVDLSSTAGGDLGIVSSDYGSMYFISDFIATNNPGISLPCSSESLTKIVTKHYDETLSYSTTYQNDNELKIKLPSNSLFEIEAVIIYSSSSGLPDIKFDWSVTGDYELFHDGRVIKNAGTGASVFSDVELTLNVFAFTTSNPAGTISGGEMPYYEKILMKTGDSGCILQLRWAQNTLRVETIQVDKGSYIRAIKL